MELSLNVQRFSAIPKESMKKWRKYTDRIVMPHVLLVDDEAPLRESLTYTLQKAGFHVTTASDGLSAIKQFHKQVPDIVLLDLMLPQADGMEVCWRLRAFSDVPIVMLTAKDHDMDEMRGREAGADDYVTKPFEIDDLIARMRTVLDRHARKQS